MSDQGIRVVVTRSTREANERLARGESLIGTFPVSYVGRLPGPDQHKHTPEEERTGNWFVGRRVAFVFAEPAQGEDTA